MTELQTKLLKSVLLGAVIVFFCILPLGLFESWFWNQWSWGDSGHVVRTDTPAFWGHVAWDALKVTGMTLFKYWFVTFPFIALYARWAYRRNRSICQP